MRSRRSTGRPSGARRRGQALTEFALVLPVMVLILLIAVDFGRLYFANISDVNAAREGANYAAAHAADNPFDLTTFNQGAHDAAIGQLNAQGQGGGGTLTVAPPVCFSPSAPATPIACNVASDYAAGAGNLVTVGVSQPFTFLTPLIGTFFGPSLTLKTAATAPVINPSSASVVTATPTPTPVATPTPSPTPSPTPVATPTPTPVATPTPTPTPTPVVCLTPVVTLTASPSNGGNKDTTITPTFTATFTHGPVTSWSWDFGDGGTSTNASPVQHTYTYTGTVDPHSGHGPPQTWTARVTVTTTPGCTGSGQTIIGLDP